MANILTWITNIISIASKFGPVLSWLLTMFPQMGIIPKLLAILDKVNKNPNYPLLDLLKDIADLFSNSVVPQPMPPGMAGVSGAPMYHEVFSTQQCTAAYHMLPDDIKQHTIDLVNKGNAAEVASIPWPAITTIWSIFGPWAQKMIELFIQSWLSKRGPAITALKAQLKAHVVAPAAPIPPMPPAVAP